jgi:hypothetical protein
MKSVRKKAGEKEERGIGEKKRRRGTRKRRIIIIVFGCHF